MINPPPKLPTQEYAYLCRNLLGYYSRNFRVGSVPCKTGLLSDLLLFVRVMNKLLENLHANICRFRSFRHPPHVSGYFWKRRVFSSVFQKIRLHKWRIRIVFGRPHENAKQRKYDSIPHRACLMLVLNDVLHHRIRKPPFSSVHTKTSGQRIKKVSRWRLF